MIRTNRTLCLFLVAISAAGCSQSPSKTDGLAIAPYTPVSGSVGFDITILPSSKGTTQWMATYSSKGKIAKFGVEFGPSKVAKAQGPTDSPITFGEGRIAAEPGSDASVLLTDLKKAREAKQVPKSVERMESLPFTFATIGENLSQAPAGGFNAKPPGNWTATKIFIGQGEQEGEVFLNINAAIKKGQFSIKDADYGDIVLSQLARVL